MEALTQLSIGIYTPRLLSPPPAKKPVFKPHAAVSGGSTTSKWADRLLADFQFLPSTSDPPDVTTATPPLPLPSLPERHVSIPLDFYRVLGAESHFLGDGIRRAYDARVSKQPQYGYSDDVLISRRQILQAACETLANPSSRREYNQGLADDEFDTILTQVPWDKVFLILSIVVLLFSEKMLRFFYVNVEDNKIRNMVIWQFTVVSSIVVPKKR